jgi:hypothetical protein
MMGWPNVGVAAGAATAVGGFAKGSAMLKTVKNAPVKQKRNARKMRG